MLGTEDSKVFKDAIKHARSKMVFNRRACKQMKQANLFLSVEDIASKEIRYHR